MYYPDIDYSYLNPIEHYAGLGDWLEEKTGWHPGEYAGKASRAVEGMTTWHPGEFAGQGWNWWEPGKVAGTASEKIEDVTTWHPGEFGGQAYDWWHPGKIAGTLWDKTGGAFMGGMKDVATEGLNLANLMIMAPVIIGIALVFVIMVVVIVKIAKKK